MFLPKSLSWDVVRRIQRCIDEQAYIAALTTLQNATQRKRRRTEHSEEVRARTETLDMRDSTQRLHLKDLGDPEIRLADVKACTIGRPALFDDPAGPAKLLLNLPKGILPTSERFIELWQSCQEDIQNKSHLVLLMEHVSRLSGGTSRAFLSAARGDDSSLNLVKTVIEGRVAGMRLKLAALPLEARRLMPNVAHEVKQLYRDPRHGLSGTEDPKYCMSALVSLYNLAVFAASLGN